MPLLVAKRSSPAIILVIRAVWMSTSGGVSAQRYKVCWAVLLIHSACLSQPSKKHLGSVFPSLFVCPFFYNMSASDILWSCKGQNDEGACSVLLHSMDPASCPKKTGAGSAHRNRLCCKHKTQEERARAREIMSLLQHLKWELFGWES